MPATEAGSIRPNDTRPATSSTESPLAALSSSAVRLAPVTIAAGVSVAAVLGTSAGLLRGPPWLLPDPRWPPPDDGRGVPVSPAALPCVATPFSLPERDAPERPAAAADGCDAVRSGRPACARDWVACAAPFAAAAVVVAACAAAVLAVVAAVPGVPASPTTWRPRRPDESSGRRAVRR